MYPRNNATPPRLAIGQVVQISDGAIQSSGVTITVRVEGGSEATGGGTTAYGADGTVYYTPTQAETNYTAFVVIANKASCYSASITVVTTATAVAGTVDVGAVSGDTTAADNLELDYDGTGYAKANSTIGTATDVTNGVTASTVTDKTGYSISGTKNTLDDLNDVSAAEVNTQVDTALSDIGLDHLIAASVTGTDIADNSIIARMVSKSATADWDSFDNTTDALEALADAGLTTGAIADAVWDEAFSGHNVAGSFGKILRQIYEGVVSQDGAVNDASATTTTFITNLTQTTDGFYHDKVIVFVSGSLAGQARHIETYTGSTKSITVSQAFTSAPANADEFLILATHEHSISEIQDGLATSAEITALNDISAADVNAQVLDVLTVDTFAEPTAVPAASATIEDMLHWIYTLSRNKITQTSTTSTLRNDADGADIGSATVSDDGTTFTRQKYS